MNVRGEMIFANVSTAVSAGDGVQFDTLLPQPLPIPTGKRGIVNSYTGETSGAYSAPMYDGLELIRRIFNRIDCPSAVVSVGGTSGNVFVAFTQTATSGIHGKIQGQPFVMSGASGMSGAMPSGASTTSAQIRKVLVTLGGFPSTLPMAPDGAGMAVTSGTLGFVVGSAFATPAGSCVSGTQALSFFDLVPLPLASAGEVPLAWVNIVNSYGAASAVLASWIVNDLRAIQGINLSAMLAGRAQP